MLGASPPISRTSIPPRPRSSRIVRKQRRGRTRARRLLGGKTAASTAGYSGTPLAQKLGIKANRPFALINPPDDFDRTLGPLPDGALVQRNLRGDRPLDVI